MPATLTTVFRWVDSTSWELDFFGLPHRIPWPQDVDPTVANNDPFEIEHLLRAIGASIAIPGVITAPLIDGRIHVDGGVVNPVPFDHVRDGVDLVVAIDVTARPKAVHGGRAGNLDVAIGSMLIMFNRIAELKRALNPPDIYIQPEIDNIGTADFFKVKDIFRQAEAAQERLRRALKAETEV